MKKSKTKSTKKHIKTIKPAKKIVKKTTKSQKSMKPKTKPSTPKKVSAPSQKTTPQPISKGRDITVVNIVVSTDLKHDVPLEKMAATLSNTEYNPEQFPGLVLRIKDPKTSALIFSSGKVVCTGARGMDKVEESIQKIIKSLEKINIFIKIKPEINIQNMVASGSVGMDLNLNKLAMKLDNVEYEPEQFPGLVYKLKAAKATFLLFSNGKVVCTGTKSETAVHEALDKLIDNLKKVM